MSYKVVVVGATGNVGREMLNILDEREFPITEIAVLASRKSLGTDVSFGDKTLKTSDLASFDFSGWDIALFAVGSEATKEYAPKAAAAGRVTRMYCSARISRLRLFTTLANSLAWCRWWVSLQGGVLPVMRCCWVVAM